MDIEKTLQEKIEEVEAKIKDAEENFGETEIRDAIIEKAEVYLQH